MAYMRQSVQVQSGPGLGEYDAQRQPWTWMFYPPPYDFQDPDAVAPPQPVFLARAGEMHLGREASAGLGCGCGCGGGGCAQRGMGQDAGGLFGSGLFAGGLDLSTWGIGEWAIVAIGAYMIFSTFSTTARAGSAVAGYRRKRRSRARRKADLESQLSEF
jgi:hypothetical protein